MAHFNISSSSIESLTGLGFKKENLKDCIIEETDISSLNLNVESVKLIALIDEINSGMSAEDFGKSYSGDDFTLSEVESTQLAQLVKTNNYSIRNLVFNTTPFNDSIATLPLFNKLKSNGLIDAQFCLRSTMEDISSENLMSNGLTIQDLKGALFNNISTNDLMFLSSSQHQVSILLSEDPQSGNYRYNVKGTFTAISADGHFATASHVLNALLDSNGALTKPISITGTDPGEFYTYNPEDVEILYNNEDADLAIIHIKNYAEETQARDFVPIGSPTDHEALLIHFGYPNALDPFYALGNPVAWNDTDQISVIIDAPQGDPLVGGAYHYIDSSATLSPGMSGGGTFTEVDGQWILAGINLYHQGIEGSFNSTFITLNPEETSDMELKTILEEIIR